MFSFMMIMHMVLLTACGNGQNSGTVDTVSEVTETMTQDVGSTDPDENAGEEQQTTAVEDDTNGTGETREDAGDRKDNAVRLQPEWTKDAVVYEVNVRQYTPEGTFAAFSEHLQQLKDMGIQVLWFMPIHPISETKRSGVLGSYYSITDYCEVNPEFGSKEDFSNLVSKAHEMGFHVMMDWVANHTGWDNAWIKDHPDWYTQDAQGNVISPEGMGWPDVADLNYDNTEMRAEMIRCMKYWVEEFDIDGFRCDYANGVPADFWEEARAELEKIKPFYMLAEDDKTKELLEYAFDMNYNWGLYDTLLQLHNDNKNAGTIKLYIPNSFPDGTYTLNFLDNHDKNSYEGTIMEHFSEDDLPLMFSLIYTIPGAPLIYTGDEIGLDHAIAFMEKDTVDWESTGRSYRDLLAALGDIRSTNPALYCGNFGGAAEYYDVESKYILAFCRQKDGNTVKCIFNVTKREHELDVSQIIDGSETVLLHGAAGQQTDMQQHLVGDDNLSGTISLKPWEFYILSENQ